MGKVLKWVGVVLIVAFLGIQFVRPDRSNPPADESLFYANHVRVPPGIARILERSCFDCHSHKTVWPWYSQIAPVSWLVADDVQGGRKHLNFSRWGAYTKVRQLTALNDIVDEVASKGMPLSDYLILHSGARLDSSDRAEIIAWAESEKEKIVP
jgi:Haem-binding domain